MIGYLKAFTGPKLFWIHGIQKVAKRSGGFDEHLLLGSSYQPNTAEKWGQFLATWVQFLTELTVYSSPLFVYLFAPRPLTDFKKNFQYFGSLSGAAASVYLVAIILRGFGRLASPNYMQFIRVLSKAQENMNPQTKQALLRYDFEFNAWPVEYKVTENMNNKFLPPLEWNISDFPKRALAWSMINTFGLKLIYPGSMKWILQSMLGPVLTESRAKLVQQNNGERNKIQTYDGNYIDSMFFDRRKMEGKGEYLVICSEGNAGFYEVGMVNTPLEAGYSCLGWNHPGFWGSSGSPTPSQDGHAVNAVMQYAINVLGFPVEKIIVYGWSIGGFTSSWLAMNYPNIKALILDATFDHLLPLAIPRMPKMLEPIVQTAILDNVNLNVSKQLKEFSGPVRIIRRTKDEMISTDENDYIRTNRGNVLLIDLLKHRFPKLIDPESLMQLSIFLSYDQVGQASYLSDVSIHDEEFEILINSFIEENGEIYPMNIGNEYSPKTKTKMLIYLANKYRTEYDSGHNNPLPSSLFQLPWTPKPKQQS